MNLKRTQAQRVFTFVLIALTLAALACNLPGLRGPAGSAETPTPTVDVSQLPPTAPKIIAQRPFPGEELPLDGSIDIYFDQPMNRSSVEEALRIEPPIEADLVWIDDSTLRIVPKPGALDRATRYRITVTDSARSVEGLSVESVARLDIQTVGFLEVSEVFPPPGAGAVETTSVITVFFNRPVVPLVIAEDMSDLPQPLRFEPDIPGHGEWINTSIYTWTPDPALAGGQTYRVTVEAGLEDQTGGVMEEPYSWEFTTLPPQIVSVTPEDGSFDVPLDTEIAVIFNQPMDAASVQAAFSLVETVSGQAVQGTFEWDEAGQKMTFTPTGLLSLNGLYEVSLTAGALSAGGGLPLTDSYNWAFQTVAAPAVVGSDPPDGSTGADLYGITLYFSAPMDEDTLENRLVVEPELPDTAVIFYNSYDNSLNVNVALEASTTYTVTLLPGAADPYGHTIDQPYTFSFTTRPYDPSVQINARGQVGMYDAARPTEFFVSYRNISQIDFQLVSLSLEEFTRLTGPDSYENLRNYTPSPQQIIRSWSVPAEGALNEMSVVRVPVVPEEGGSLEPGLYLLTADAPEIDGLLRHLMIVSTANLTFKSSFDESLVWLTDLQSGQPVGGVTVSFFDSDLNLLAQGVTDANGVLEIETPHQDTLWDIRYALADEGGLFALARTSWDEGIAPWVFGLPGNFNFQDFALYLYTDRPIYRPGQEVFFRGILRNKNDTTYTLPSYASVDITIYNDQGDVIYEGSLPLDEFGAFDSSLTLAEDASLGYYTIEARIGDRFTQRGFQVAEYRRPEFMVDVEPERDAVLVGEEIALTVDAEFFFGGPVSDATVTWTALADTYFFDYQGSGNYSFTDFDVDEGLAPREGFVPGFGEVIAEGEGRTDANGQYVIRLPASLEDSSTSRRLTIEAIVEDVSGQTVADRAEVIIHRGQYYVGVRPGVYIGAAGEQQTADLIVVDWDSRAVPNREVTVQIVERRWNSVREEDEFGRTQWTWSVEEIPVGDPITVRVDDQGRATVEFVPPRGGTYKIRATVTDDAGNTVSGSAFMWVYGGEFVAWRQPNNDRIDLIADRDSYSPGDEAEILITSPFAGDDVRALVTVERGSILSHEVITLRSNSTVYRLPITGDLAPNVFVSVVIVKGVDDTTPVPEFRMGLVRLQVEPIEQTLHLNVLPDRKQVGPREEVTYRIEATDFAGNPVDAEVSLALVDLATLSLAPPNSSPIVEYFYGSEGLGVQTSIPMIYLVDRITQQLVDEGKGGGGGGGEGFFEIRSEFEDTAYWSARVRTGEDGIAEVTITLPDNLTTWRMDARGVTKDTLVGQAQVDIVATKPLLVRPQTPRFFVAEDEATLSAVVHNNTQEEIEAVVSLETEGVTLLAEDVQRVTIPAGGRVEVNWPVTVDADAEWVDLVFGVQGGGLSDASKPPLGDPAHDQMLPVYRYEVPETVGTAGQLVGEEARIEGIALPPTYDVQRGQLEVRIDPSLAASVLDGLTWLEHFPYECTEQVVSRFLPNALTLRAFREFNLSDPELEANLEEQVNIGLQKLYAQQHVDGGWGWFVNSESNPTVTAYVVQGLIAAREAGIPVEERVLQDGIVYLSGELRPLTVLNDHSALDRQAYILYVLALAGQPDAARSTQLYEAREGLQHWARALLAQTLWMIDPADPRLADLQSDLGNRAIMSATGAHWEEESDDSWNWNTDTRSTAIILDTFARLWPEHELAPNAVRWLMTARQGEHWQTTQETAWALIALTDWMTATRELEADYRWEVEFNGQLRARGQASRETVRESETFIVDVSEMLHDVVNRLSFERTAGPGRLYYTAHLSAYLPVEEVEPLSRGVIVSRRYLDANGQPVTEGRAGDILTVELTIVAPYDLYYVVVEDPYPAGAEAVDVGLLTESVLGERPTLQPDDPLAQGWGWWWFSETDLRDERAVLFADYLPAGTYQYTYQLRLGVVGRFRVIPPTAREFYAPEVYGRGAGMLFTVLPE